MSTPDTTTAPVADPVAPAAPAAPATTPPPAAAATPGPWDNDLNTVFTDPAQRAQVDAFLRGHVQPYATGLEQKVAELAGAEALVNDLRNDPAATHLALTEELFGADVAKRVGDALNPAAPADPAAPPVTETAPPVTETAPPARDPEVQALLDERKQNADIAAYEASVAELVAKDPSVVPSEFNPFVVTAQGDMQAAYNGYKAWQAEVAARYGAPVDPAAPPPPALGTEAAQTTPPLAERGMTIAQAIDDHFDSVKAAPPPPVGAV